LITIKLLGGAKKSFGTELISADLDNKTIQNLLEYLLSIKPKNTLELDTKNILVAVNGVDSSALQGRSTELRAGDVVSIIPVIHGGSRMQFKIDGKYVELLGVSHQKGKNYDLLESIRKKFPGIVLEGITSKCILSPTHAKKIIGLSLYAHKHKLLLSKKLQTDILLRFAATTQISLAVKTVGINKDDDFTIIAIGKKQTLDRLCKHVAPYLSRQQYGKNAMHLQRLFKISKTQIRAASSRTPLEDLLMERAAVLVK
jgi:molybdopterin converting factor small subunit/tRNA threonylcarbamoyladenosine modification (KEOPS) complex Cgi121 subunit